LKDDRERIAKSKKIVAQYKKVFGSHDGKAVLYDLLKANFLAPGSPSVAVQGDTNSTFENIGRQNLCKEICRMLKVDPETFFTMQEQQEGEHV
jgi:hypothetical protein